MPLAEERSVREGINLLYHGRSRRAVAFRYGLLTFDVVTIGFFVVSSFFEMSPLILGLDLAIAGVLVADYVLRLWVAPNRWRFVLHLTSIADVIVIASLLAPLLLENLAFLRVVRTLRLLRSYHVLADLRERAAFFKRNEEVIQSVVNLLVFIFVVTALVYVAQADDNVAIANYMDALYFTVTTLTTTGFGDITLEGDVGHLLSVLIMVVGVGLFLRLVQTIFRPMKVRHRCPDCGLNRHEPDAVHCKHCGRVLDIESEGA